MRCFLTPIVRLLQLLNSHNFKCGEEILTIAAMTSVQNVFVFGEGAAGAMGEIERRKFTAEEGVSIPTAAGSLKQSKI